MGKWFLLLIMLWVLPLLAQSGAVEITVDRENTTMGDPISLQITVQGVRQLNSWPKLLGSEHFEVTQGGVSSSFNTFNGETSASVTYSYSLYPKEKGSFSIGGAEQIVIAGKKFSSNKVQITVGGTPKVAESDRPFFIEASLDQKEVYVNQQVIYTFRFYNRADIKGANLGLPDFKGFWKEILEKGKEFSSTVNGILWKVTEIRFALFPTRAGEITLPAVSLELVVIERDKNSGRSIHDRLGIRSFFEEDGFFNSARLKKVQLQGDPIKLIVKNLPETGKPEDFSGLVGDLTLSANLSKKQLKVGESATLTLELKGDGNMRDALFPEQKMANLKMYDDKPSLQEIPGDRLVGIKTLKRAIVPTQEGELVIPPLKVVLFNPKSHSYQTIQSEQLLLQILPGDEQAVSPTFADQSHQPTSQKKEVRVLAQDLLPIWGVESIQSHCGMSQTEKIVDFIIVILCPLLYLFIFWWKRREERMALDSKGVMRSHAYKQFLAGLKKIKGEGKGVSGDLSKLLGHYLSAKLGLEGTAITVVDIERLLRPNSKVKDSLIEEIKSFLRECDMAQYGGGGDFPLQKNKERVGLIIKELEKVL